MKLKLSPVGRPGKGLRGWLNCPGRTIPRPTGDSRGTDLGEPAIADRISSEAALLDQIAAAVDLQEGASGVRRVLRAISELDQASAKAVSNRAGLPVPIVAAVNNELRSRGVLDTQRPSRLTERGAALAAEVAPVLHFDPTCECCGGHGVQVPPELIDVVAELDAIAVRAPEADLTLDQSH